MPRTCPQRRGGSCLMSRDSISPAGGPSVLSNKGQDKGRVSGSLPTRSAGAGPSCASGGGPGLRLRWDPVWGAVGSSLHCSQGQPGGVRAHGLLIGAPGSPVSSPCCTRTATADCPALIDSQRSGVTEGLRSPRLACAGPRCLPAGSGGPGRTWLQGPCSPGAHSPLRDVCRPHLAWPGPCPSCRPERLARCPGSPRWAPRLA